MSGHFNKIQLSFYECIRDARKSIIGAMKPGVTYDDLARIGKKVYENHGLARYWTGYVGHFVGMSLHDVGRDVGAYEKPFVPGVVFNVEPLIEDKEMKVHIRLEDTILITTTGAEILTADSPVEPDAIHDLMDQIGIGE